MKKIAVLTTFFLLFFSYQILAISFDVQDIHLPDQVLKYKVFDLNGDSLKEIIVFAKSGKKRLAPPRIHILWQTADGFSDENVQTFFPDKRAILCDFGDIAGDSKLEFIMLTPRGIIYYAQNDSRFEIHSLEALKVTSIFRVNEKSKLPYWDFVKNITPGGRDEIIIPQFNRTLIFSQSDSSNWEKIGTLNLSAKANISAFKRLDISYKTNKIYISDCNRDGLPDVLAQDKDIFYLFYQTEKNTFSAQPNLTIDMKFTPDEPKPGEETSITAIKDINGDGVLDLLANKLAARESILNPQSQLQIYLGKNGARRLWSLTPDQIIVSTGVQFDEQMVDLNGDDKLDLAIPSVKLGLMRIIKMLLTKSVTVGMRIFQMDENGKYPEQPNVVKNFTIKFNFNINNDGATGEGMVPVFDVKGDFNGDGLRDLITTIDQRHLDFYFGKPKKIFSSSSNARFPVVIPKNGNRLQIFELNQDKKSDIVITYQKQDDKTRKMMKIVRVLVNKN